VVALEAVGEGVQVGLVVGLDVGDPVVEAAAVQAGEDLGELGDVPGERVQVRARARARARLAFSSSSRLSGCLRIQLARSRAFGGPGTAGGAAPAPRNGWR